MPVLYVRQVAGAWKAEVPTSGISYPFSQTDGGPTVWIQVLAAAMQQGEAAVSQGAPDIFILPPGTTGSQAVKSLFCSTDQLAYRDQIIWGTVGQDSLLDDLDPAGIALQRAVLGG